MSDLNAIDVLLVENNPRDAELTIRALKKKHPADNIHVVEDGAEALDFVFARGIYAERNMDDIPKVILLDLNLPRINGLEVLRALKSDERTQVIPVVVVTSSAEDQDVKAAYELGANSYVIKPMKFEMFVEALSRLGDYWSTLNHSTKRRR